MKRIYRNDIIFNIVIILLCISVPFAHSLLSNADKKTVIVSYDGNVKKRIDLSDGGVYQIHGVEVTVKDGRAFVSNSSCPDGLCMKMKDAENVGDTIICVPNKVSVRISGQDVIGEADVVAG